MRCAWNELLAVLPMWMRADVDRLGRERLQELRIRIHALPQLIMHGEQRQLTQTATEDDINFVINTASKYSPWAAETVSQGYITALGGHRIGVCGEAVVHNGNMTGIRSASSLCIRVARDYPGLANKLRTQQGSILIIGRPGSGKTTLLRDLIRLRSNAGSGCVAVVDERKELFPPGDFFSIGIRTDIMSGCSKVNGIEILLRTMGPTTIAVDEITSESDCQALIQAGWCGVSLLATAHAASRKDLISRSVYRPLLGCKLFDTLVIMQEDKSWKWERMEL